jgi:hypothetical protein
MCFLQAIWLNSGYLGIGSLAAGVANPSRSFPLLVVALCPFIFAVNVAPFLISLCVDDDPSNYESGHFSVIAEQVAGQWLRHCMLVGAVVCTVALYANCIIIPEVSMQFFVESAFPSLASGVKAGADTEPRSAGADGVHWVWKHEDGE